MLRELYDRIQSTAANAKGLVLTPVNDEVYALHPVDGTVSIYAKDQPPQAGELLSVGDLAITLSTYANDSHIPVCFVSNSEVELCIDATDRQRNTWTLHLFTSERWEKLSKGVSFSQKALVRWLRENEVPTTVVQSFRKLQFNRRSDGTRTVEHGKESLGRSVEAEVNGSIDIPEEIQIDVRVFKNHPFVGRLILGVEIDHENERVEFFPIESSLDSVQEQALASVYEDVMAELSGTNCVVIRGTRS